jgi:hypothetical protein
LRTLEDWKIQSFLAAAALGQETFLVQVGESTVDLIWTQLQDLGAKEAKELAAAERPQLFEEE